MYKETRFSDYSLSPVKLPQSPIFAILTVFDKWDMFLGPVIDNYFCVAYIGYIATTTAAATLVGVRYLNEQDILGTPPTMLLTFMPGS